MIYGGGIRRYGIIKRGNFLVHFNVVTPKTVSQKAAEILKAYQKEEDAHAKNSKRWWKQAYGIWNSLI